MTANGVELTPHGTLGIGPLAIGNIKYKTEFGLFQKMIAAEKPVRFDFRDAFSARARAQWIDRRVSDRRGLGPCARRVGPARRLSCRSSSISSATRTRSAVAHAHHRLADGLAHGMRARRGASPRSKSLSRGRAPLGVVCGTGFEDRPELLARIAQRWPLIGNSAGNRRADQGSGGVRRRSVARLRHPASRRSRWQRPADPDGWLVKRRGGAGGSHVSRAGRRQRRDAGTLFPAARPGRAHIGADPRRWPPCAPCSASARNGLRPRRQQPFRYGGAVTPADIAPAMTDRARPR